MKFHSIYRISFYLMLLLSTLIMCMDATEDSKFEQEVGLELLVETARMWRSLGPLEPPVRG